MADEIEYIAYPKIKHVKLFLDRVKYRNKHFHRDIELGFLMDGKGVFETGDGSFELRSGDAILLRSNESHSISGEGDGVLCLFIQLSTHFLRDYVPSLRNEDFETCLLSSYFDADSLEKLRKTAIFCVKSYIQNAPQFEFDVLSGLSAIAAELLRKVPHHSVSEGEIRRQRQNAERMNRIIASIDEHYLGAARLEEIAEKEGITATHLSHVFSSTMGMSFQEYLSFRRLEEAVRLIGQGNMTLLEISLAAGFSDQKYMTKMFRKRFGCSPKEFAANPRLYVPAPKGKSPLEHIYGDDEALQAIASFESTLSCDPVRV